MREVIDTMLIPTLRWVFGILQFALGAMILALPLITPKKPKGIFKKRVMLLCIAAAGILFLRYLSFYIINVLRSHTYGHPLNIAFYAYFEFLLYDILEVIFALAFPFCVSLSKTVRPRLGFLLAVPFVCYTACLLKFGIYAFGEPAYIYGIVVMILSLAVFVLAAVWYIKGKDRRRTLVLSAVIPAVFIVSWILAAAGRIAYNTATGETGHTLFGVFFWSSNVFFPDPQRFLLLMLFAMVLRTLLNTPKPQSAPQNLPF